jgi:predicted component of type VI protein secretion system
MWDTGGDVEPGTQEIAELFDDPLQKAAHWIRQGARLFDVGLDNLPACRRWLTLLGVNPDEWPREKWYALALLLPNLHRVAGKESGIRLALQMLLDLPLLKVERSRAFTYLPEDDLSRLGTQASRLGTDLVLGDRAEDLECLTLVLGPVPLATYRAFQGDPGRREIDIVLGLCAPCFQPYRIRWTVNYPDRSPRLGFQEENARLGVNSHLGMAGRRAVRAMAEGI